MLISSVLSAQVIYLVSLLSFEFRSQRLCECTCERSNLILIFMQSDFNFILKIMKEHLQEIMSKYSFPKRDINTSVTISDVESYANLKLPGDYIFYLENYFGIDQFIGVEFINLWSLEEIIEINKSYNIVEELTRTIGIGSNGSGEFIGIEIDQSDNVKIILSPFIDLDSKYNIKIGESFTDFLIRLDNGIDWFS
jgi:hypothetical protein